MKIILKTTPSFDKKASKVLTPKALDSLFDYLEANPDKGDIISGTSGVRKPRWETGKNNKGKSGGVRVLYHYSKNILILLIALYSKAERDNISQKEKNELRHIIPQLVSKYIEGL